MNISCMAFQYDGESILVLDQRYLPHQETWILVEEVDHAVHLIQTLAIRGAPLLGVFGALTLAHFAQKNQMSSDEIMKSSSKLKKARPTAVNLQWAIDRLLRENVKLEASGLLFTAKKIYEEDRGMCEKIGSHGESLIADGANVLTICNAGGLATAGIGTALGVIQKAKESRKKFHVYFCETRPLLQGSRLTSWELKKLDVSHTLLCDSAVGSLMREKKIYACFVGADRIAKNGDTANKIGTYNMAVLAKQNNVPFYVVAPSSTVDTNCLTGSEIEIEQRKNSEVLGVSGQDGYVSLAPDDCSVYNPAFDVTPRELITGFVLDSGVKTCGQF